MSKRKYLLERVAIAVLRFKDDPTSEKRLRTIDNLIEELRELSNEQD